MKQLTIISKSLHFQVVKFTLNVQILPVILINLQTLKYNRNDRFVYFLERNPSVAVLKPVSVFGKIDKNENSSATFFHGPTEMHY